MTSRELLKYYYEVIILMQKRANQTFISLDELDKNFHQISKDLELAEKKVDLIEENHKLHEKLDAATRHIALMDLSIRV